MVVEATSARHSESVARKHITIRLSDEERSRLLALADHHGLSASDLVRMLLRHEERAAGLAPAKAAKKAAKR